MIASGKEVALVVWLPVSHSACLAYWIGGLEPETPSPRLLWLYLYEGVECHDVNDVSAVLHHVRQLPSTYCCAAAHAPSTPAIRPHGSAEPVL